jgi:hypothetical protein
VTATQREIRLTCPKTWAEEYQRTGTVAVWNSCNQTWFPAAPQSTRVGTLDLFAQHALMHLLAVSENVESMTWMYLADVDRAARAACLAGEQWRRPAPNGRSANTTRTAAAWANIRRHMGDADFDALQEALVRAGFTRFAGEPDLFCFDPKTSRWFFAEAKGRDQLGEKQTNPSGTGWFDVSLETLGEKGRVRVYRVTPTA